MLTFLPIFSFLAALAFQPPAPIEQTPSQIPSSPAITIPVTTMADGGQISGRPSAISVGQVVRTQEVRRLPGSLDAVPVLNSNSPEVIQQDGVLLSTFPPDKMADPLAHLNYAFDGRFDIFSHHVARGLNTNDVRTMYTGIILYNPGSTSVNINVSHAASYLSQEAPFFDLPSAMNNPLGTIFSGPGSRVMGEVLRGLRQPYWPTTVTIPPQRTHLLVNLPIPLRRLSVPVNGTLPPGQLILPPMTQGVSDRGSRFSPWLRSRWLRHRQLIATTVENDGSLNLNSPSPNSPSSNSPSPYFNHGEAEYISQGLPTNGRTTLMRLFSSGPVYVAKLAMYAPLTPDNHERVPNLGEWTKILTQKGLAGPRDYPPTPPDAQQFSRFFYGRVAGVARGSQWIATLTDNARSSQLTLPEPAQPISYVLSTLDHNTFGTGQIQSAQMVHRYDDTAYRAHGNYGIHYNLSLPLYNDSTTAKRVVIKFETPIQNEGQPNTLTFLNPPEDRIFFRGTVLVRYIDGWNLPQARFFHLVQKRGQQGEPLVQLKLNPGDRRLVKVEFLYPPDATPPQVLTVETLM